MNRRYLLVAALIIAAAAMYWFFTRDANAEDYPVGVPSTCEEPIYQETPGATVPAETPSPICTVTPEASPSVPDVPSAVPGSEGDEGAGPSSESIITLPATGWSDASSDTKGTILFGTAALLGLSGYLFRRKAERE